MQPVIVAPLQDFAAISVVLMYVRSALSVTPTGLFTSRVFNLERVYRALGSCRAQTWCCESPDLKKKLLPRQQVICTRHFTVQVEFVKIPARGVDREDVDCKERRAMRSFHWVSEIYKTNFANGLNPVRTFCAFYTKEAYLIKQNYVSCSTQYKLCSVDPVITKTSGQKMASL